MLSQAITELATKSAVWLLCYYYPAVTTRCMPLTRTEDTEKLNLGDKTKFLRLHLSAEVSKESLKEIRESQETLERERAESDPREQLVDLSQKDQD